jgi:hypothetical protein
VTAPEVTWDFRIASGRRAWAISFARTSDRICFGDPNKESKMKELSEATLRKCESESKGGGNKILTGGHT